MIARYTGAVALAALLAACSQPNAGPDPAISPVAASEADECFFLSQVSGYTDAPDEEQGTDRIYVRIGPSDTYLFETFGACPDLNFAETIGFDQNGPGQICKGIDVDLVVPGPIGAQRCPVRMIRKLSETEEAAR